MTNEIRAFKTHNSSYLPIPSTLQRKETHHQVQKGKTFTLIPQKTSEVTRAHLPMYFIIGISLPMFMRRARPQIIKSPLQNHQRYRRRCWHLLHAYPAEHVWQSETQPAGSTYFLKRPLYTSLYTHFGLGWRRFALSSPGAIKMFPTFDSRPYCYIWLHNMAVLQLQQLPMETHTVNLPNVQPVIPSVATNDHRY